MTNNMTETVLKFLYDNRQSLQYVKINHLFIDKKPIDVRYFIRELVKKEFILMHSYKYDMLGNGNPIVDIDSIELKAKIRSQGELHYIDTYMKKNDQNTLNIGQFVNVGGDNNAPISLANNHSDSKASQSIAIERKKRETAIQIIKYASLILSPIAAAIAIYQFFIK